MFRPDDTESIEDDYDLKRVILQFMRLRETTYIHELIKPKPTCVKTCKKKSIEDIENIADDYVSMVMKDLSSDESDVEDSSKQIISNQSLESLWKKIYDELKLQRDGEIDEYIDNYTSIIKLHIDFNTPISSICYFSFFNCSNPEFINKIFNKNLIDPFEISHMDCLYDSGRLFSSFQSGSFGESSMYPLNLILSLSVLIYKTRCLKKSSSIFKSMCNHLAAYTNGNRSNEKFKTIGVKHFLRACILNGVINQRQFNEFLANTKRQVYNNSSDSDSSEDEMDLDSDRWSSYDENDDDEGTDENDEPIMMNRRVIAQMRNQIRQEERNRQQEQSKTVAESIKVSQAEFKSFFPLSLKNLVRIKIKNELKDYTKQNVNKLRIMPFVLREFLLFQDEINDIFKVYKSANATPQVQASQPLSINIS